MSIINPRLLHRKIHKRNTALAAEENARKDLPVMIGIDHYIDHNKLQKVVSTDLDSFYVNEDVSESEVELHNERHVITDSANVD